MHKEVVKIRNKKPAEDKKTVEKEISISLQDAFMFLVSSVRYALGRKTYIVGWTCDKVRRIGPWLEPHQRFTLVRDIVNHGRFGGTYGHECDKKEWQDLVYFLISDLPPDEVVLAQIKNFCDLKPR